MSSSSSASSTSAPTFMSVSLSQPFDWDAAREYTASVQGAGIMVTAAYVAIIFGIKHYMRDRKPMEFPLSLRLWNAWLALFSILGSLITSYGLLREIYTYGLVSSYTQSRDFYQGTVGLWTFWFCMSKFAELGDTIFIVLRKRPLIFLHWYHHVATLNYGLMSYVDKTAYNTWIVWLNFSVHAIMYTYYFLAACKIRLPAWFARNITTSQITQFLITLAILFHVGWLMVSGARVDTTVPTYLYCLVMEISYVLLFGNFFLQSYVLGGGKKFQREKQQHKPNGVANGNGVMAAAGEHHQQQNGSLKSE